MLSSFRNHILNKVAITFSLLQAVMRILKKLTTKTTEKVITLLKPIINSFLSKELNDAFTLQQIQFGFDKRSCTIILKPIGEETHFHLTLEGITFLKIDESYSLTFEKIKSSHLWLERLMEIFIAKTGEGKSISFPAKHNMTIKTVKAFLPF